MLECKWLSLKYKYGHSENLVLDSVDLKIETGENVVVLGPSGSGKSSLIYLFSGLKKPTDGSIFLDGTDVSTLKENQYSDLRRKKVRLHITNAFSDFLPYRYRKCNDRRARF